MMIISLTLLVIAGFWIKEAEQEKRDEYLISESIYYDGDSSLDLHEIEITDNEHVTLTGTLSENDYSILVLDNPVTLVTKNEGKTYRKEETIEVMLDFSDTESISELSLLQGKRVLVEGNVVAAHTIHHTRPIVLTEAIVRMEESEVQDNIFQPLGGNAGRKNIETINKAYKNLIMGKKYKEYVNEEWEWMSPFTTYALIDINQDKIPELLIDSVDDMGEWHLALVFTYNITEGKIQFVQDIYYYSEIQYSQKYKAITFSEFRPDVVKIEDYYTTDNAELVHLFSVGWDKTVAEDYNFFNTPDMESQKISEEELKKYFSELMLIEFLPFSNMEEGEVEGNSISTDYLHNLLRAFKDEDEEKIKDIWQNEETRKFVINMENEYIKLYSDEEKSKGVGVYKFNNGDYGFYYGDYENSLRNGNGIWIGKDMENNIWYDYRGEWKENYPNGQGTYRWLMEGNTLRIHRGRFFNGKAEGKLELEQLRENGKRYHAVFYAKDGIPEEITDEELIGNFKKEEGLYIYAISEEEPKVCWKSIDGWRIAVHGATKTD